MFKQIIVPLDGSSLAECVLPHVISLAEAYTCEVTLIQVLKCSTETGSDPIDPLAWEMRKAEGEAYLENTTKRLKEAGIRQLKTILLEGEPAQRLIEHIQSSDTDLIVMSSHGNTGLSRWNVSSVVRKVVQRANRSSLIVRAYETPEFTTLKGVRYGCIFIPLDGSQRAEYALSTAITLARFHEALLLLGHVIGRPELPQQMLISGEDRALVERIVSRQQKIGEQYMEQVRNRLEVEHEIEMRVHDDITSSLHEISDDYRVDLVVICAHGSSGRAKWPFGSKTSSFIEYGKTPLLIIQDLPPDEIEPTEAERAAAEKKGH